ncbi:syntaxin-18-like [Ylistrum balloti]|uniref:syntaxin-18-like n=1 Tax=Ylistrum balloti TaxID=509963 RepID=UPI0029058C67|nr:syntaxin-18-like [Ylistrum balloti]
MADVTNLFKATIKTVKSRNKVLGDFANGGKKNNSSNSIFPASKQKGDFEQKAKEMVSNITRLRDFLLEHRKEYVNAGSHVTMEASRMTDAERDQIDSDAQDIIKTCRETIMKLKTESEVQKVHPQVKDHRDGVIRLIEEYLKVVCKIYSEQKAVRVKRVVDRKRISKLEPERKKRKELLDAKEAKERKTENNMDIVESEKSSRSSLPPENPMFDDDDSDISPEDAQMFERENQTLFDEMNSLAQEVSHIEGQVVEIARLQEIFTEKVLEQDKDIDRIAENVVGATENIKDGNEEIREAIKNSAGLRVWILFFFLVLPLSLLFLHWYND